MIQPKHLVAAFAFVGLLATGGVANADGKFYVEGGASWATNVDDVTTPFTNENLGAVWDLDDMKGLKLQIGGDFGHFRTDVKIRGMFGDVDSITGGVTNVNAEAVRHFEPAQFATVTLNAYVDLTEYNVGGDATITPFIGLGGGMGIGFLESNGTLLGVLRRENHNDHGNVWSGTVGALFSVNEHFGLSLDYERLQTNIGGVDMNTFNAGIRVTF